MKKNRRRENRGELKKLHKKQRDMKNVYDHTRLLSEQRAAQSKLVKDTNGMALTGIDDHLNR